MSTRTARDVSSNGFSYDRHRQSPRSEQTGIGSKRRRNKLHLVDRNRLRPLSRVMLDTIKELRSGPEYSTTENDHRRIEQTHEIGCSHSPQLDRIVKDSCCNDISIIVSRKYVGRGQMVTAEKRPII